jgi:hypothetical protein
MADSVEFVDRTITCRECRAPFLFAISEQRLYETHALRPPKLCLPCRRWWRLPRDSRGDRPGGTRPSRTEMVDALKSAYAELFLVGDPRAEQVANALASRRFASLRAALTVLSSDAAFPSDVTATS